MHAIETVIERIERTSISFWGWVLAFSALVFVRNVLEAFSQRDDAIIAADAAFFFLHSTAFYLAGFLGIILILWFVTREDVVRVSRFVLVVAVLILLPPFLDLIATGGAGALMIYRTLPDLRTVGDVARSFAAFSLQSPYGLFFFGGNSHPLAQLHVNYGIRIEVLLEFLVFAWYLFVKTRSAMRLLFGMLMLYGGLFFIGTFPSLLVWALHSSLETLHVGVFSALNLELRSEDWIIPLFLVFFIVLQASLWFFAYDRKKFFAVLRNIRPSRLAMNLFVLSVGLALGLKTLPPGTSLTIVDGWLIGLAYVALTLYWLWAVTYNDIADERGDRISMPDRPLPAGILRRSEMKLVAGAVLVLTYVAARIVGYGFFILIFVRSCLAYLYSSPPFRLKRIPLISNVVIALAYAATMFAGYTIVGTSSLLAFPGKILLVLLIGYTLGSGFKDIKDYAGDKHDGIRTLPVLFGEERGKRIVAALGIAAFLLFPAFYPEHAWLLLTPSFIAGILYAYFVTRAEYREWPIFAVYFIYVGFVGIACWLGVIAI